MNIYDYVIEQKALYKKPINISEGWDWSMYLHLRRSTLYKNSQFELQNDKRDKRPFKNIVRPILNIQYRTEGFDVKDIEIYVNNPDTYYKSFLVKKFHETWALEHEMDTFIDDVVESYVDYGGVLVKNVDEVRPEVVNLNTIAFCDQTDILSGPFGIKHNMSPQELRDQKGWGDDAKGATISIEALIALADSEKETDEKKNTTPGKYIEIFEVHGTFPDSMLEGKDDTDESKYTPQIHIIGFYKNDNDENVGVTLFSSREPTLPFKFLARDKINGRALGFGGVEELFEAQIWTNYSEIQMRSMLELASKTFYKTTDIRFKTRNKLINADNGQIFDHQQGTDISQIDTTPRNLVVFENAVNKWEEHANRMGAASEISLGEAPTAGTPFKSVEAQLIEGKSLHLWRQGKIAVFIDEIYRDWVLPYIMKELVKGQRFLSDLSTDELQFVSKQVTKNLTNKRIKKMILDGEVFREGQIEQIQETITQQFLDGGQKKFIEILKEELKGESLSVKTTIKGKQKNLALLTDKVVNVLRQFIATPEIRQDPEMIKLLNIILESSGMSPMIFGASSLPVKQEGSTASQPLKELAASNKIAV